MEVIGTAMKHNIAQPLRLALTLLAITAGSILVSSVRAVDPPQDATCLECHSDMDKTLIGTPHRLASTTGKPAAKVACISCHAGWEKHLDNPGRGTIVNPSLLHGDSANNACYACHTPHRDLDNHGFDTHTTLQTNCASCHKVHGNTSSLLIDGDSDFCRKCHQNTVTKFARRSSHPIESGAVSCLSCHRFVKRTDQDQMFGFAATCQSCHPQQAGPFVHEHAPVNSYMTNGGGCTECHDPHGSENDLLLNQPQERLCSACHMAPPAHNTAHNSAYANVDCLSCHGEIHGSVTTRKLLSSNLDSKFGQTCWCHGAN